MSDSKNKDIVKDTIGSLLIIIGSIIVGIELKSIEKKKEKYSKFITPLKWILGISFVLFGTLWVSGVFDKHEDTKSEPLNALKYDLPLSLKGNKKYLNPKYHSSNVYLPILTFEKGSIIISHITTEQDLDIKYNSKIKIKNKEGFFLDVTNEHIYLDKYGATSAGILNGTTENALIFTKDPSEKSDFELIPIDQSKTNNYVLPGENFNIVNSLYGLVTFKKCRSQEVCKGDQQIDNIYVVSNINNINLSAPINKTEFLFSF